MLVSSFVDRIIAPNPGPFTGPGTNTYIVGREKVAVIDPGPEDPAHVQAILDYLAHRNLQAATILVTHSHRDHLPAAYRLRDETGARLLAHQAIEGVDSALADGQEVPVESASLKALYTPGHAKDHLCFLLESEKLLFTGDLILGQGTVVIWPPGGDMTEYMASLDSLLQKDVRWILPGHWPPVDSPQTRIAEYIEHRKRREAEVLECLVRGMTTVQEIVSQLYVGVDPRLVRAAGGSVTAHLIKLEREGVVRSRSDEWLVISD